MSVPTLVFVLLNLTWATFAPAGNAHVPQGPIEAETFSTKTAGARATSGLASGGAYWNLWSNGYLETPISFHEAASTTLSVRARGTPLGGVQARMVVAFDGATVLDRTVTGSFAWYVSASLSVAEGVHTVRIRFTNDARSGSEDRNLHVDVLQFAEATAPPPPPPPSPTSSREAENFALKTAGGRGTSAAASGGAYWNLWSNGYIQDSLNGDGTTALVVVARGTPLGGVWPTMVVSVDGVTTATFTVAASDWTVYSAPAMPTGNQVVRVAFTNDAASSTEDRNLHLDVVRVGGGSPPPTTTAPPPTTTVPPGGSSKEAELFATKSTGGLGSSASASGGKYWNVWSNGHIQDTLTGDGTSGLQVVARGTDLNGVWPTMVVSYDGTIAATFTVDAATWTTYTAPALPTGSHTVRIAFTNDALSITEDRNLYLDVARTGTATSGSAFTLNADASATMSFTWTGGPGLVKAQVATSLTDNRGPSLSVLVNGTVLRMARVMGPVQRPFVASFDLPNGTYTAKFTATGSTVIVAEAGVSRTPFPTNFTGVGARVHVGGSGQGSGWRFTDYGYIDSPLVVPTSGWYELRVQGVGTIGEVGPLVHLWLNRTVVAEGVQSTTIDLRATRYLVAGIGYALGASYENPASAGGARFDVVSATYTGVAPPPLPSAPIVLPRNDPLGWPQYGRDNYNTRSNPDASMPTAATASSVTLKWRRAVDGSVTGTPAVVDGRVYFGTWNHSFYCVNEVTGAIIWKTTLPNNVDGSAAVTQGLVVVSYGAGFAAMNAATGAIVWTQSFGGHSWSSPTVEGDDIFVGIGAGHGYVARLNLQTGAVIWKTPTTPITNSGARVWASPLVPPGSGHVVVGTSPGTITGQSAFQDALLAYDRTTGQLVWHHQFFPRDTNAEATPEETVAANRDMSGTPHLVVVDGRARVFASQKHGPAWAVDLADGSLVHGSRLMEPRTPLVGSGGAAEGVEVISATDPDRVAGFDVVTGDLLWEAPMPSTNFAPVAIAGGLVWIGSWEGHVHAIDLHTGREVTRLDAGGGVLGGTALAGGRLFTGALERPQNNQFYSSLGILAGSVSMWS